MLQDGQISQEEQLKMADARMRLGINEEDAEKIFSRIAREEIQRKNVCPHCRKPLHARRVDDKQA